MPFSNLPLNWKHHSPAIYLKDTCNRDIGAAGGFSLDMLSVFFLLQVQTNQVVKAFHFVSGFFFEVSWAEKLDGGIGAISVFLLPTLPTTKVSLPQILEGRTLGT